MKEKWKIFIHGLRSTFFHFGWFNLFVIPFFLVLNLVFILRIQTTSTLIDNQLFTEEIGEVQQIDLYVNLRLTHLLEDIHVIKNANDTQAYVDHPDASTMDEFKQFIYRMADSKPEFLRMMIVDPHGDITYRVNRDHESISEQTTDLGSIASEDYFDIATSIDHELVYISSVLIIEDAPTLMLIFAISNGTDVLNYVRIDYDANVFLHVFDLYNGLQDSYFTYSIINGSNVWQVKDDLGINFILEDMTADELQAAIASDPYLTSYDFELREYSDHFYSDIENYMQIVVSIDRVSAVNDSNYLILKAPWIVIFYNLLSIVILAILAHLVRLRSDDYLLINANMFLTAQNENAVIITDKKFRVTYVNRSFKEHYGYELKEIYLKPLDQVIATDLPLVENILQTHNTFEHHQWKMSKTGIYILKFLRYRKQSSFGGRDQHYVGIFSEPHIELNHFIEYAQDKLKTVSVIKQIFGVRPFNQSKSVLMLIHIDQTTTIEVANYLRDALKDGYDIFIPQNAFVMIHTYAKDDKAFDQMIEHMDQLLENYRFLPHASRNFSHLFVTAKTQATIQTEESLIDALLTTMAVMRNKRHLKHLVFEPSMSATIEHEKAIKSELEHGFKRHEFFMNYQIQQDLKTKKFVGAEALLRWQNPRLGSVSPAEFIPVIENGFYINQLSLMVVNLVLNDIKTYKDALPSDFYFAINLSAFDINNDYMITKIIDAVESSGIPPSLIMFEITESHYLDNISKINRTIALLHSKGIQIAIDDFGTGYSSINSLKQLDVDYVKIDRSFIMDYPVKDNGHMLKTLIELIQGLDKKIIVEGTETIKHVQFCDDHHCERIQGYYIAKPLMIDDMIDRFINKKK